LREPGDAPAWANFWKRKNEKYETEKALEMCGGGCGKIHRRERGRGPRFFVITRGGDGGSKRDGRIT